MDDAYEAMEATARGHFLLHAAEAKEANEQWRLAENYKAERDALAARVTELRAALEEARKDFDRICHNCALPQDQDLYFLADSGRDSVEQALAALTQSPGGDHEPA